MNVYIKINEANIRENPIMNLSPSIQETWSVIESRKSTRKHFDHIGRLKICHLDADKHDFAKNTKNTCLVTLSGFSKIRPVVHTNESWPYRYMTWSGVTVWGAPRSIPTILGASNYVLVHSFAQFSNIFPYCTVRCCVISAIGPTQ